VQPIGSEFRASTQTTARYPYLEFLNDL
jgi:hypothetical protein